MKKLIKQQELEDIKLEKAGGRAKRERDMEIAEHTEKLRQKEAEIVQEEAATKRKNDQNLAYLTTLKNLGVDLTQYLIATSPTGPHTKIDPEVKQKK